MGISCLMKRSVFTAAIIISRFQKLLSQQFIQSEKFCIYPIMDGAFITSKSKQDLLNFLENVFVSLSDNFVNENNNFYKFIVRACISYGLVGHGNDIDDLDFKNKDKLVFGLPIIQSFTQEHKAPPFGIYIHQSARLMAPLVNEKTGDDFDHKPFSTRWYVWFKNNESMQRELLLRLNEYYDWCESQSYSLPYDTNKVKKHKEMAKQYFQMMV
ncbi:MAG: hypothetical protein BGO43_03300 [Gammaproteobacteria bacterium 39-13]|nr:MAG: hypothetical protein BGO43_03300 [Gammaproteobacteria bacterium 39-13]